MNTKKEIVSLKEEIVKLIQKEEQDNIQYNQRIEEAKNDYNYDLIDMENEISHLYQENRKLKEQLSQSTKYILRLIKFETNLK